MPLSPEPDPVSSWKKGLPAIAGAAQPDPSHKPIDFSKSTPAIAPTLRYLFVMPIEDLQQAARKIAGFLNTLNKLGGLRLKYRITGGEGARDPQGIESRQIYVELAGPDVPLVIQHNGELLRALETLAAQMLRLDHHEHDLVSFDAANFKALRAAGATHGRRNGRGEGAPDGSSLQLSAHEQPRAATAASGLPVA